tara:strand:+ start:446 stop:610 length:165 start_codon:yes stop_codon:yes gene_type:complete
MRKELLPNGLLSVYDYGCQWQLLFKKGKDKKWKPYNMQAHGVGYRKLLQKINED